MQEWCQGARVVLADTPLLPPVEHKFWSGDIRLVLFAHRWTCHGISIPSGWHMHTQLYAHRDFGGVTDGRWFVGALSRRPFSGTPSVRVCPPRAFFWWLVTWNQGTRRETLAFAGALFWMLLPSSAQPFSCHGGCTQQLQPCTRDGSGHAF